jgi:hypothetical protein
VGDELGVVARIVAGEAGDSGRRNGEDLGDPKDRGDGLYPAGTDCDPLVSCTKSRFLLRG